MLGTSDLRSAVWKSWWNSVSIVWPRTTCLFSRKAMPPLRSIRHWRFPVVSRNPSSIHFTRMAPIWRHTHLVQEGCRLYHLAPAAWDMVLALVVVSHFPSELLEGISMF